MFTRILVPTDFSEPSDAALEYAKALATRFGASLHLIHVVEDALVTGVFGGEAYIPESMGVVEGMREDAEHRLNARLTPLERNRLRATVGVLNGPNAPTILNTAREWGIDLIVMGTHGRTGVVHALMGSVAERVVRSAPCPVLTVHAQMPSVVTKPEMLREPVGVTA